MRTMKVVLSLLCALALMGAVATTASANQICSGFGDAPVRRAPDAGSGVWGFLRPGQTFQVYNRAANGFFYGYAFGGINHVGYVNGNYLC